jgi:hypothetical protein
MVESKFQMTTCALNECYSYVHVFYMRAYSLGLHVRLSPRKFWQANANIRVFDIVACLKRNALKVVYSMRFVHFRPPSNLI